MKCMNCGAPLAPDDRFCPECGTRVNVNTAQQWFEEDSWEQADPLPGHRYTGQSQRGFSNQRYSGAPQSSVYEEEAKSGAGIKIALTIAILAFVVALGALVFFMLRKGDDKKIASEVTTEVASEETPVAVATTAATTQAATSTTKQTTESKAAKEPAKAGDYILPDSSSRYLKSSDVSGLSKYELRIARNEIYARHGRKFNDQELQKYFNAKSWYKGTIAPDDFVDERILSQLERDNIKLIMSFE